MIYSFKCDVCGVTKEVESPIKVGAPSGVSCKCGPMHQEFGCNFVLLGDNWPGKSLKKIEYKMGEEREKTDQMLTDNDRKKRLANEVLKERRKGKKSFKKYEENNKVKVREYFKNMKDGIKGK